MFAALPAGPLDYGFVALAAPALAGALAGWWFLREGENHFDEWLSIKVRARWFTAVHPPCAGRGDRLRRGLLAAGLAWLARGSAGLGRLTEIGADPLRMALFLAAEVGIGVVIGYVAGPWLERQQKLREADLNNGQQPLEQRALGAAVSAIAWAVAWAGTSPAVSCIPRSPPARRVRA